MKKWIVSSFFSILAFLVLTGCIGQTPTPAVCPTITIATACPYVSSPTQAPTPIPFASSFLPYKVISVQVAVDVLNMRNGPGKLFSVRSTYAKDVIFWVYGRDPGDNWLFVRYFPDIFGWVDARFVTSIADFTQIPAIIPSNTYVVRGRVLDKDGNPAAYIGFEVSQGSGSSAASTQAITNENGLFFAYLPDAQAGTWTVAFTSYGCPPNSGDTCNRSGTVFPKSTTITLPPSDTPLEFLWDGN